ncbi:MAG TPA: MFS transporter [Rubrobacteraceae bacterium]|nr:MFS transporter [Rubrobacteraceae bacterium]
MRKETQLALSGLVVVAMAYGFARYGYGLFVPVFEREFGLSTEEIGLVSSGAYAAHLFAMVLTGLLTRKTGPRFPVVAGAVCAAVGMLLISVARGPLLLLAGAVLAGTSSGFCWAPFSDAVAILVERERRNRVLSVISTGTAFGLVVAGPVVLLVSAGGESFGWRYAWVLFSAVALSVALWNLKLLPNEPYDGVGVEKDEKLNIGWFLCPRSAPLLGQAFSYGLVAAFYYTYAIDFIRQSGFSSEWGPIFWGLVGVSGIIGVLGGDAVSHFGLRRCLTVCLTILGISVGGLGFSSGFGVLVVVCALTFGASYMLVAAFLVVWSGAVFYERPATGFTAVLISLAAGSILGPSLLGVLAGVLSLETAFWCAAALTVLSTMLRPVSDIRNAAPEKPNVATH